jgi:hypothetical protein
MKPIKLFIAISICFFAVKSTLAQVGISATAGFTPDPKAMLDITSTTKGLLIPRMTTAQRNAIASPTTSLMVFDMDVKTYWYFNGAEWKEIGVGSSSGFTGWNLLGNTGTNPAINFIGNIDPVNLNIFTNNIQRMQVGKDGLIGIGADYLDKNRLHVYSTTEDNGIFSNLKLPFATGVLQISAAIRGLNTSKSNGNRYGGYFESDGYDPGSSGNNVGLAAIAKNANTNIGLYASSFNNNANNWAGHFDVGHVKITNTLAIGQNPTTLNMLELLKPDTKHGAFFDLPNIGKTNNVYIGKRLSNTDLIGLEINVENTPTGRALEVHGRSTFYDKVGINTTIIPAAYSLAVNGFIIAEELRIQNSTLWPDYVFDTKYKLKPLSEVSEFIKINKHLPEVPSAKTVENEGIILGEMQKTLLKKIEELTLYIIDQQKQIDELKTKVGTNNKY